MPVKLQGDATEEWRRSIACPEGAAAAAVRLFCLPHAGSGAAGFMRWRRMLSADVAVCPALLPGRELRLKESCATSLVAVVATILQAMRDGELLSRPYALFGHSMGALIAYELACRIEQAGLPGPIRLIVSGREAPHAAFSHRTLHLLEDQVFLAELQRRYGGLDALLDEPELREVFLPVLRADLTLVETYQWTQRPKLHCPVEALAGVEDRSVSPAGLAAWGELTDGAFTSGRLPGDHFFHFGAGQAELLRRLGAALRH